MTRKPPALSSFAPEILQTLIEGSRRLIELEMPYAEAVVMRMRLHSLRARMRLDGHELLNIVQGAKVTISWPPDTRIRESTRGVKYPADPTTIVKLIIAPQDLNFLSAIKKAGIEVEAPIPLPSLDPSIDPSKTEDVIENFLSKKKAV